MAAVVYDFYITKIPNYLILIGYVMGMCLLIYQMGWYGIFVFLGRALWPIVLFYVLYLMRSLGAGDIKLMSVVSVFFSLEDTSIILILSFLTGAICAFIRMKRTNQLYFRLRNLKDYAQKCYLQGRLLPYETAIISDSYLHFSIFILLGFVLSLGWEVFY